MTSRAGQGRVALVTGGSKGVGRGIAVGLAEAGWTVHVSGRNQERLAETVRQVHAAGGRGRSWTCEHTEDDDVTALVKGVAVDAGRLDMLVNNAWAGPRMNHTQPERLWERPLSDWDTLIGVGLRAHYVALHTAAPILIAQGSGLVVNISSVGTRAYLHSTLYGMSKAALDKMTHDAALELRDVGVTVLSLWPGLVRTEQLLASGIQDVAGVQVANAEAPELQGRVLAVLAADPDLHRRTGQALITAEVAEEYDVVDPDGRRPVSPRALFGGGPIFPDLPS